MMSDIHKAKRALRTTLQQFMPERQITTLYDSLDGEEGEWIAATVLATASVVESMPKTYETNGQGDEAKVYLHYFRGTIDAWVTEKDKGMGVMDTRQTQAFGLITLSGDKSDAELGYIDIDNLIRHNVELDLYWEVKTLAEVRRA